MTGATPGPKKLNVMDVAQGGGRTQPDILISDTDDLVMEGYDTGPDVEAFLGDDDYEYWVTVPKEHKDWLLLSVTKRIRKTELRHRRCQGARGSRGA
jgi:hypothetical protein